MSQRAVLMSIKPKYADLIFAGTKTIELRRVVSVAPSAMLTGLLRRVRNCHSSGFYDCCYQAAARPTLPLRALSQLAGVRLAASLAIMPGRRVRTSSR